MTVTKPQYVCLSYELSSSMPHPADLPGVDIEPISSIPPDVSNVFSLRLCNHFVYLEEGVDP